MTKGQNIVMIPKQASASYPQHCDNTKLRPVPLNPNQASASYTQDCDNTKLRPVPLIHKIVTIPNSGQGLLSTEKYMDKRPMHACKQS